MFNRFLALGVVISLCTLGAPLAADTASMAAAPHAVAVLPAADTDRAILQALNRLTFGPQPGEVERVRHEGLAKWIERQLNPSGRNSSDLEQRLARLSTLNLDSQTLAKDIHQPARRERQARLRSAAANPAGPSNAPDAAMAENSATASDKAGRRQPQAGVREVSDVVRRDQQIIGDLSEAKLLRAAYSDRQLEEVLVDFWFNHFNVFAAKGPTRVWLGEFERDAIRPNVFGNFRTMLGAVAASPAMLFYLDNWMNVEEKTEGRGKTQERRAGPLARRATGLNENYARELMELHTIGVDGGYSQQDVVNVARAFTGWTLRLGGGFEFDPRRHDNAEKTVLGHTIKADGGMTDGQQVLDILAAHPATARFIAEKLSRRFVSDNPPAALVDRVAATFIATHGDLRATTRTIVTSPEFFAAAAQHAKVKTPFEFVVSAIRATGTDVSNALPLVRELRELGMPLYLCQPPTGYDDTAATWVSSGALVSRMNFALALGSGRLRGVTTPFADSSPLADVRASLLANALAGQASPQTQATIEKATTVEQTVALALGSPEFQKR